MTFSDTVSQQREQQEKTLKRFIAYSLAGSFVLHGVGLCLKVNNLWKPEQAKSEEILMVTTETPEEVAEAIPEPLAEPESTAFDGGEVGGGGGSAGEAGAATMMEPPPAPLAAAPEVPVEADPVLEEPTPAPTPAPTPEPTPVPLAENIKEPTPAPTPEPPVAEKPLEKPVAEVTTPAPSPVPQLPKPQKEVAKATPAPRNLNDLLAELRRAREQASQTNANRGNSELPGAVSGQGDRGTTTATGPNRSGFGSGSGSGQARVQVQDQVQVGGRNRKQVVTKPLLQRSLLSEVANLARFNVAAVISNTQMRLMALKVRLEW